MVVRPAAGLMWVDLFVLIFTLKEEQRMNLNGIFLSGGNVVLLSLILLTVYSVLGQPTTDHFTSAHPQRASSRCNVEHNLCCICTIISYWIVSCFLCLLVSFASDVFGGVPKLIHSRNSKRLSDE